VARKTIINIIYKNMSSSHIGGVLLNGERDIEAFSITPPI